MTRWYRLADGTIGATNIEPAPEVGGTWTHHGRKAAMEVVAVGATRIEVEP